MAFVKEFISEADREKYNLDMYRLNRDSKSWVIDRERDCFLRWLGCDSNRPDMGIECPYEHWLFYYRGTAMMLDMFINGSKKHRPCITYQIDYIYIYRNSSKISISQSDILNLLNIDRDCFISLLKEGMDITSLYYDNLEKQEYASCFYFVFKGE